MTTKYFSALLSFFLMLQFAAAQSPRSIVNFNNSWKFFLGDDSTAINPSYNDSKWRNLNLPHDWSIESNFIKDAPATNQGGSLPGGIGWYRKTFTLPASAKNKNASIEFDGVYKNSEVWINGNYLGNRPYGYINFSYNLTPWLFFNKQNVIAVKVDNSLQPDSRWYTGSGIYRDVKLVMKPKIFFDEEKTFITTGVKNNEVSINIYSEIKNYTSSLYSYQIKYQVFDKNGIEQLPIYNYNTSKNTRLSSKGATMSFEFIFRNLRLWSTSNPNIYTLKKSLFVDDKLADEQSIPFGIRSFNFNPQKGFFLNNQPLKLHGVCMHHDLGALGAAFNKSAAKRQLKILKEMGCNAIRFSHNPPASDMLDLCDEMGFLVIDEAFDMWKKKKNKYDYHKDFTEWHKKDVEAMIRRDRNHPSVIAWSIGNEIREQFDSTGITITKELVDIVKKIDPTRPVLSAVTETLPKKNFIAKANALDILGFNYKDFDYKYLPQRFPNMPFIATETASALATRGVYNRNSDTLQIWPPDYKHQDNFDGGYADFTVPAYDNTHAYWGNTHEKSWLAVKNNPHIAGAFVWSGFDYLGEPLPYPKFPARSSYYGIVDLAGFPKDVYYMYQSEWTNKNVLHIFPNWNNDNNTDSVDVWAYYNNADEVELFLNGKSVGKRSKTDSTLHVQWRVKYEPGVLKAVSKRNSNVVLTKEVKTAGAPYKIQLLIENKKIKVNENELAFVTARITDKEGNFVTGADRQITFSVSTGGKIAGTDNGYQADTVSLQSNKRISWKGLALAIIKSNVKKGNITVSASAEGLKKATITFTAIE